MARRPAVIRTARLDVRPLDMEDLEAFHTVWGDPDVIFWGASPDLEATRHTLTRLLPRTIPGVTPSGWFAVIDRHDGAFVGDVVLQPSPWARDHVEIGWHIAAAKQGRGYATEAARGLLEYARDVGIRRVEAVILPRNLPSQTVAVRLGMRNTGTVIEHGGLPHDLWTIDPTAPDAIKGARTGAVTNSTTAARSHLRP